MMFLIGHAIYINIHNDGGPAHQRARHAPAKHR